MKVHPETPEIQDPRNLLDFDVSLLPLCDGGNGPLPGATGTMDIRMIQFMGIYYRMNAAVRVGESASPEEQKACSAEICRLGLIRDRLEDRYVAEGFLAEPLMEGQYYSNLLFFWSGKPPAPFGVFQYALEAEIIF